MLNDAIGGYFELEFPAPKASLYPYALRFQSARAAFLALLRAGKPKRVWMPYHICGTMFTSLEQAGVQFSYYKLDLDFHLAHDISMEDGDWLLYVNYFGVREAYIESLLARFDPKSIVIDCSQALFSAPHDCLATIYSPRKFLGVPDGGLLVSSIPLSAPRIIDDGSFDRAIPLMKRLAFSAEEGYADHHRADLTLFGQEPKSMSNLTRKILSTIDYEEVRRSRKRNFEFLHRHLGKYNRLQVDPTGISAALCYPLLIESTQLREFLIGKRIFVAMYWADVFERLDGAGHEKYLVQSMVPLPCDQRYGLKEMEAVVDACLAFFGKTPHKKQNGEA